MTKKLILLTLALPLVLMICIFALTKTVGQMVEAPVTGMEIVGETIVYLNLDEGESCTLNYAVYPTNAKNKEVSVKFEKIGNNPLAEFAPAEIADGTVVLTPTSAGAARVTLTTINGGIGKSVDVYVLSSACDSINCTPENARLFVGESLMIQTEYLPSKPKDKRLTYQSSDESVLTVNAAGKITAVGRGEATVTISLTYVPEGHDPIFDTVTITVGVRDAFDLESSNKSTTSAAGSIAISMGDGIAADVERFSCKVYDAQGNVVENAPLTVAFVLSGGKLSANYVFDEGVYGEYTLRVSYEQEDGSVVSEDCKLTRVQTSDFSVSFEDAIKDVEINAQDILAYEITPADMKSKVTLEDYTLSSDCIEFNKKFGIFTAKKAGSCTITLKFRTEDGVEKEFSHSILVLPTAFSIKEGSGTYGDENLLAIGGVKADGSTSEHKLTLSTNLAHGEQGSSFSDVFSFVATNTDKVTVDGDGIIQFKDASFVGPVTFVARFDNGEVQRDSEPFTVYCVANGVDVASYLDLLYATRNALPVVLQKDIAEDFGYDENGQVVYTELHTTYDDTHYKNLGIVDEAKVKVLLSFKNDVYGNGYTINAGRVAYGLDEAGKLKGDALFRGPLNFVSMTEPDLDPGNAMTSIKGQDNICFALYENVSLRNVTLYGCTLEADTDGNIDLTDLTYTGTTVEVLGDNVDISYARIANGRTVLRAFGDASDSTKPIHLNISNTVLSGSREFIMRIGSNCMKDGSLENPSPNLDYANDDTHHTKENYNSLTNEKKQAYDEKFIKTFVTVKNSIFKDAGLFAVGVESHFGGGALADGKTIAEKFNILKGTGLLDSWYDLAKTSYGAKLSFEGDVRMYTWKTLDSVDSSSLIDAPELSKFRELITFDISEMLEKISEEYTGILTVKNETKWVHAGIAFFGGGKNYGVFENNVQTSVSNYRITFSQIERYYMTAAAGEQPFYFCLYDQVNGINVDRQLQDLASEEANAPIKIK